MNEEYIEMPYIKDREAVHMTGPQNEGELNYVITKTIDRYLHMYMGTSYKCINEVIGVLECAKLELYRRIAAPYEDKKCEENGDVYEQGTG